ncbi:MAG: hypothetical protein MI923_06550 [Phycisphaerales bacterium]|nr:hypothetical protein [Phycisphaerales bacterium]
MEAEIGQRRIVARRFEAHMIHQIFLIGPHAERVSRTAVAYEEAGSNQKNGGAKIAFFRGRASKMMIKKQPGVGR